MSHLFPVTENDSEGVRRLDGAQRPEVQRDSDQSGLR